MKYGIFVILLIVDYLPVNSTKISALPARSGREGLSLSPFPVGIELHLPTTIEAMSLFAYNLNPLRNPEIYSCKSIPTIVENLEVLMLLAFSLVKSSDPERIDWLFGTSLFQKIWKDSDSHEEGSFRDILERQIRPVIHLCSASDIERLSDIYNKFTMFADQAGTMSSSNPPSALISDLLELVFIPLSFSLGSETVTAKWVTDQISFYFFLQVSTDVKGETRVLPLGLTEDFLRLKDSEAFMYMRFANDLIEDLTSHFVTHSDDSGIATREATAPTERLLELARTSATTGTEPELSIPVVPRSDDPKKKHERPTKSPPKAKRPLSAPGRVQSGKA